MPNSIKYSTTGDTQSLRSGNFYFGVGDIGKGPSELTGYYNGIDPPISGYTIYVNATGNLTSIFCANNDNELIKFTNGFSGQNFTGSTQCLNWYNTQTNYTCVNKNYEPIVTDGLVLNMDAGFTPSYSSSGVTWYDLSYGQNDGTLINGPTFNPDNEGSIVFDGINSYVSLPQSTPNQTYGNYSFSLWLSFTTTRTPSSTSNSMIMEAQNTLLGGVDNYLYALSNSTVAGTNGRIGFQTFNPLSTVYTTTNTWVGGQWYNIVCTYNISTSTQSIYVNGVLEGSATIASCYFNTNTYFGIGAYSVPPRQWFFNGKISNFVVYSKTLSTQEILQNYNVTKGRFGL